MHFCDISPLSDNYTKYHCLIITTLIRWIVKNRVVLAIDYRHTLKTRPLSPQWRTFWFPSTSEGRWRGRSIPGCLCSSLLSLPVHRARTSFQTPPRGVCVCVCVWVCVCVCVCVSCRLINKDRTSNGWMGKYWQLNTIQWRFLVGIWTYFEDCHQVSRQSQVYTCMS